jgi:hypothetical protein
MHHKTHNRQQQVQPLRGILKSASRLHGTSKNYLSTLLSLALILLAATLTVQAQWDIEDSHTTASLRGIHNVGGGVAWASGTHGTVLRTEDGGYLWQTCTIPPGAENLDFRGIQAFDENTAIVMSSGPGDQSRLYKTTDGCQTWKLLFTNPDKEGFFDTLNLNAPKRDALGRPLKSSNGWGYVLGDPVDGIFRLFSTKDGGETWRQRLATERGPKGEGCKIDDFKANRDEAAFAASNQSLLALDGDYLLFVTGGSEARLLYNEVFSLDGALCHESIHSLKLPLASGRPSSGAFAAAAIPDYRDRSNRPDTLVIVGGDYLHPGDEAGTAATVVAVGVPFRQNAKAAQTQPHGYRSSVAYDTQQKLWITVGPNGTDISRDDGKNWQPLKPSGYDPADADKNWNALSLPFVVGPSGRIGRLRTITVPQNKSAQ